jgi:hypothetical protein
MSSALSEIQSHHHHPPTKQKWWKVPLFNNKPIDPSSANSTAQQPSAITPHHLQQYNSPRIFGNKLEDSLQYASVAISMIGQDQKAYIYGFIPVVVAKCGLYLKENGTLVEGIFRISGSTKRMKELQAIFDEAPFYGKDLDWKTSHSPQNQPRPPRESLSENETLSSDVPQKPYFSIHDAANVLRRYLMCLPVSLIRLLIRISLPSSNNTHIHFRIISGTPNITVDVRGSERSFRKIFRRQTESNQTI